MANTYKKILVAIDGSDEAKAALIKACEIAKQQDATLVIAHIVDTRTFATIEQYDRTVLTRAEEYGAELLAQHKTDAEETGVTNVKTVLDFGSPKVKIARDIATDENIDLIVTGATGLNAVERFLIGSVSEGIIRNAKCDVLIVRQ